MPLSMMRVDEEGKVEKEMRFTQETIKLKRFFIFPAKEHGVAVVCFSYGNSAELASESKNLSTEERPSDLIIIFVIKTSLQ